MFYLNRQSKNMIALGILMVFLLLFSTLMLQGCGKDQAKPVNQLISMYDIYNVQYADHKYKTGWEKINGTWEKTSSPTLTEEQKKILNTKRDILIEVYPLIQTYDVLVQSEGPVPPDLQLKIMNLLDKLVMTTL